MYVDVLTIEDEGMSQGIGLRKENNGAEAWSFENWERRLLCQGRKSGRPKKWL